MQPEGVLALLKTNFPKIANFYVSNNGLEDADVIQSREHALLNSKGFFYEKSDSHNGFFTESSWEDNIYWTEYEKERETHPEWRQWM